MPRALPILVIVGLAIYSFFDALQTTDDRIRRFPRTAWLVLVLVPVLGAALWFMLGRPVRSRNGYGPPRVITLRSPTRPSAPDDDSAFLKRLDEEAWKRKRDEGRAKDTADPAATTPNIDPVNPVKKKPDSDPGMDPGVAPAG